MAQSLEPRGPRLQARGSEASRFLFVFHGRWTMKHGPWSMAQGPWCPWCPLRPWCPWSRAPRPEAAGPRPRGLKVHVCCPWTMDNETWSLIHGPRSMAHGVHGVHGVHGAWRPWSMTHGQEPRILRPEAADRPDGFLMVLLMVFELWYFF